MRNQSAFRTQIEDHNEPFTFLASFVLQDVSLDAHGIHLPLRQYGMGSPQFDEPAVKIQDRLARRAQRLDIQALVIRP